MQSLQHHEGQLEGIAPIGRKRSAPMGFPLSYFGNHDTNETDSKDANSTYRDSTNALRKTISIFVDNSDQQHSDHEDNSDHNEWKESTEATPKSCLSDSLSVSNSTASTTTCSSTGEISDEDENDMDFGEVPITSLPPDALFVVQGTEFPCHTRMLFKEARPLLEVVSKDGVLDRKIKKQRTESMRSLDGKQTPAEKEKQWSSPSGITVTQLPDEIDSECFRVVMEFLYTGEIKIDRYEDNCDNWEAEDPWLEDGEHVLDASELLGDIDSDFEECCEDDLTVSKLQATGIEGKRVKAGENPISFLQRVFGLAEQFGFVSLKHAIEYRLYDEFLFALTVEELLMWSDENECAFLKEKCMDKILASSYKQGKVQNECCSKLSRVFNSPRWNRLKNELFLYEKHDCHNIDVKVPSDTNSLNATLDHNRKYFFKVEYLRRRLSELGLDTDGSREKLEERLKPHLDSVSKVFLPTILTSEKPTL